MSKKPASKSSPSSRKRKRSAGSPKKAPRRHSVPLAEVKDDLSRYLRIAESEEVIITRHGKPAGVLIGFATEEDWIEYRIENHPEFLDRVEKARSDLAAGRGVRLEDAGK